MSGPISTPSAGLSRRARRQRERRPPRRRPQNPRLEFTEMRRSIKEAAVGVRVKSIKTKRLAKSSPPTKSERAGSSDTLSAQDAERDRPPRRILRDRGSPPG